MQSPDNEERPPAGNRSGAHQTTLSTATIPALSLGRIVNDAAKVQPALEMIIDLIDYQSDTRLLAAAAYQCKRAAEAYAMLSKRFAAEHRLAGERRSADRQLCLLPSDVVTP